MVIDIHGHIGRIVEDRKEFIDVANLISKMDRWGIDITCVLPLSENPEGGYLECDTEDVIKSCTEYPDRLIPFCLIDPRYKNSPVTDFKPLLKEYKDRGCKGIGELLPKMDFDDERCINLYRQAAEFGFPVLFDMADSEYGYGLRDGYGLPKLENALKLCPDTVFIGHGPTFWAEIAKEVPSDKRTGYPSGHIKEEGAVLQLMRKYKNLWVDISAHSGYNALTRDISFTVRFINEFQDRILFGTDSCLRSDIDRVYPNVAFMKKLREEKLVSEEVIEKIEYKNCVRLLGLPIS
ncbi:MAG TPA: amidohydrolase family protein [bacterium]|nr:amidohydrolase family protein [bacterium]HPP29761.1 amidohydrolase family protein [bacterium]